MGQILAIVVSISSFVTALTVIITAIKNGEKKIRVYEDQNPSQIYVDEEDDGPELIYYVMIPVYNEEKNYEPYHTDSWNAEYEVIGKVDK